MQISLKSLLSDPLYKSATFAETIDMETYELIYEVYGIDISQSYDTKKSGNSYWEFIGDSGVKHFIRINLGAKNRFEIKLGFFDKTQAIYDKPNLYFNDNVYQYDKQVLNTYVKILIDEILPYFFKEMPNRELDFPAIDKPRYRLYKSIVNKFVDINKYEIINDDGKSKFTIKLK